MTQSPGPAGTTAFCFDIAAPMVRLSDRDILAGLRRFVEVHGPRPFTGPQFDAWKDRPFRSTTVIKRFGSWRKALSLVGVHGARPRAYDAEELMATPDRIWRPLAPRPGPKGLSRACRIGKPPYHRLWGSLPRACRLLAAHHRGELTRDELLRAGPAKPRRALPLSLRWRILKRDHHRCASCGRSPATHPGLSLQIDHIVPVSRGGGDQESNLRTLCSACNGGKSDGE